MNKTIIIKIASEIMLKNGCEAVSIDNISNRTGISVDKLYQTFPQGSEEILMDCVEYTGRKWTETIKKLVMNETGELNKINKLSSMYVLGTKEHSSSLSVYVDLWKTVKDNKNGYIKERLRNIYNYYSDEYSETVKSLNYINIPDNELKALSLIMTLLSDVIHIQSIILENNVDYNSIQYVIEKMVSKYLLS